MGRILGSMRAATATTLAIVLFSPLWLGSLPAAAEDPGSPADAARPEATSEGAHPLVAEASRLEDQLASFAERYAKLEAHLESVEGQERWATLEQLGSIRLDYLATLHELVENLFAQEQAGLDAKTLRRELEEAMPRLVQRLQGLVGHAEAEFRASRAALEEASAEDRSAASERALARLATLDALYQGMHDLLADAERLGAQVGAGRGWLKEKLASRADGLAGWLRHVSGRISALEETLAATSDDGAAKAELVIAKKQLESVASSLSAAIGILRDYEVATAEYQQLLIETTGEITGDVLDRQLVYELFRSWSTRLKKRVEEDGTGTIFKLLLFVTIILVTRVVARLIRRVVQRAVATSRLRFSQLLRDTFVSWASKIVTLLGLLIALSQLGIELGPLLAGLGVAGFIVGFALQDTLGNFASGAMILIYRPYDVGDMVEVAGVFGKVAQMSLVSTTILTIDNQSLVVPNSKIWGDVIKNVTTQTFRRVDMTFGIAYGDDVEYAERIFQSILDEDERILDDPPPQIHLHELGDSSVDFVVRPWVRTEDYGDVYWATTRAVKLRLDAEGLHIPFPQRDVHFYPSDPPDGGKAETEPEAPRT